MAGGSSSSSNSSPVDMTPQAFKNLQSPFANVVASLLGYSPSGGASGAQGASGTAGATPQGGTGGTAGTSNSAPGGNINNVPGYTYVPSPQAEGGQGGTNLGGIVPTGTNKNGAPGQGGANGAAGSTSYTGGPVPGDPNSVLSGIPGYTGNTSAPITGNEQSILDQLMGTLNNGNTGANNALAGILNGTGNQVGAGTVTAGSVDPNAVTSSFNANQNPLLQAYITAAQRGTMDNLAHTLATNGSQFTANGQFVQPTGSSAFDRAQALATQSAANAMSDIASQIGYQGYNLNQSLDQQTQGQNAANILAALQGNQTTGLSASNANASNDLSASNANAQNAISAATAQGNLSSQEVSSLVQNLQAQALPRLIEQYGLDQGLQMFNNQVNDLMTIMQTGAGVTSPVIANESKSSSNTKPNLL